MPSDHVIEVKKLEDIVAIARLGCSMWREEPPEHQQSTGSPSPPPLPLARTAAKWGTAPT
eukprot:4525585-Prymnesium_polylepis.1